MYWWEGERDEKILFILMMMVCSASLAKWEVTGATDEYTDFHEKSKIRKSGLIAKMWIMRDYYAIQTNTRGEQYKSSKELRAFNCKEHITTVISIIQYTGSMGEGKSIFNFTLKENEFKWDSIVPDTSGEVMFSIACEMQ